MSKKNIHSFEDFLKEALRDELPEHQRRLMMDRIGKKYLDMDVPTKAENIVEGEWTLSKEEKDKAIQLMFGVDIKKIEKLLEGWKPSEKFINTCQIAKTIETVISVEHPSLLDFRLMSTKIFKLISVGETRAERMIIKDAAGKPIMDENNRPQFREKPVGEIVLSNNVSNFNAFFESYMLAFPEENKLKNPFTNPAFTTVTGMAVDRGFDMDLFSKFDLQLYISGKPEDILNMSISKFYDSCQNLYSGGYNRQLPPNIFDVNVKVAYLKFNTPFTDTRRNIVPFTIFSRCLVRNIKGQFYFDNVYPGQLRGFFHEMITKHTGMKNNYKNRQYYYTSVGLGSPYMDSLSATSVKSNPNAAKDPRIQALAKELGLVPEDIFGVGKHVYITDKGTYLVLTDEEADKAINNYITNEMIYKQDVYKPFVDIQAFYEANIEKSTSEPVVVVKKKKKPDANKPEKKKEEKLLKFYKGPVDFDTIAKWAEEQPFKKIKKKDGTVERVPVPDKKNRISKHNLYRAMKPFIDPEFYAEKTTPEELAKKRKKLGIDDKQLKLDNGLYAYRQEDQSMGDDGDDDDDDY